MSKILEKSWKLLQQPISLKLLPAWGIALQRKYKTSIFTYTRWNIIVFHVFFVLTMVIVFAGMLRYTKSTILESVTSVLQEIIQGNTVDVTVLRDVYNELNDVTMFVLICMVIFALITGVIAAHITLGPTRKTMRMQKNFIASLAHELRTPLAVLHTSNEVARYDVPVDSPVRTVLDDNVSQIKQITNILNNLLVFNRFDTTDEIIFEDTEIGAIAENTLKRLHKLSEKRGVTVTANIAQTPPIVGNATAVEQAIFNITKNALLYAQKEDGLVELSVYAQDNQYVVVHVKDNGVGIPAKQLQHIFEPFFRAHGDRLPESAGTGMGLAVVLEIMKLHGGTVNVTSEEQTGTTVKLLFPYTFVAQKKTDTQSLNNSIEFNFSDAQK